jgi:hypothetical protein
MTKKQTMRGLKGTTFTDLFDLPQQEDPPRLNPLNDEEFNENIVAIAKGVLYDILMDPKEKAYTKIEAARELLNRSLGKPVARNMNADAGDIDFNEILPRIVRRAPESEE